MQIKIIKRKRAREEEGRTLERGEMKDDENLFK